MDKTIICKKCHQVNTTDDKYCIYCSAELPTFSKPIPAATPKKHNGKKAAAIISAMLAIAFLTLTIAYFCTRGPSSPSYSSNVRQLSYNTEAPQRNTEIPRQSSASDDPYAMGIPQLNGKVYNKENTMNVDILWVHYQLKATGMYYQGDNWDETGNLGDHTMEEIGKFMRANGYPGHDGHVDQTVINTLANYLGNRRVSVKVGGFYEKMNTIMTGGSAGSMESIDEKSSPRKVKWVQSCLAKLGYYRSSIDGKFGTGTINALMAFQKDHGYVERDYVSLGVARCMLEECYRRGYSLDDLP